VFYSSSELRICKNSESESCLTRAMKWNFPESEKFE
jgi:hypothetical protein